MGGLRLARRYWPALLFALLGASLGAWHDRQVDRGRSDAIASVIRTGVAPPATVLTRLRIWFSAETDWLFRGRALEADNRRLRAQVANLEQQNAALEAAAAEDLRLRADMGFYKVTRPPPLSAEVIGLHPDPQFDTLLIDRGSQDGVHPHSVVVTPQGLVGQVWEVSPSTATVVLLTDQNGAVGARIQRAASRDVGICRGNYSSLVPMIDLPSDADVRRGDIVVTSGFGSIPAGIRVGTVVGVSTDPGGITRTATVKPSVPFNRLEEVFVLR